MDNGILKFLGSDSGFGDCNNSAYIEDNTKFILIDCGYTVFNIVRSKFDLKKYAEIDVIITHLHNDHAGSLSQFIMYLWFGYGKKVNVYSKCSRIKDYLEITGTPEEAYNLTNGNNNLKFIKTNHAKELDAYGFEMKYKDKKFVYTGDTCILEPYCEYLEDADEFYVDISVGSDVHLKIKDVLEKLKDIKNNGTEIYIMHTDDKMYIKQIIGNEFIIV